MRIAHALQEGKQPPKVRGDLLEHESRLQSRRSKDAAAGEGAGGAARATGSDCAGNGLGGRGGGGPGAARRRCPLAPARRGGGPRNRGTVGVAQRAAPRHRGACHAPKARAGPLRGPPHRSSRHPKVAPRVQRAGTMPNPSTLPVTPKPPPVCSAPAPPAALCARSGAHT